MRDIRRAGDSWQLLLQLQFALFLHFSLQCIIYPPFAAPLRAVVFPDASIFVFMENCCLDVHIYIYMLVQDMYVWVVFVPSACANLLTNIHTPGYTVLSLFSYFEHILRDLLSAEWTVGFSIFGHDFLHF